MEVDTVNRRANGESESSFHATIAAAAFPSPTHNQFKKHQAKARREEKGKANGSPAKKGKPSKAKAKPQLKAGIKSTTKRKGKKT